MLWFSDIVGGARIDVFGATKQISL